MIRVETINGGSADDVVVGTPFEALSAVFPSELISFTSKDATLKQITDLAPFGRGSRVTVTGSGGGRSATLRAIAIELQAVEDIELQIVLAGVRPEEVAEWKSGGVEPAVSSFGSSPDAQAQLIERAIDAARKVAAGGAHAAVVIDGLDHAGAPAARRATAAARKLDGAGSLTVIAAAPAAIGGETTLVALDVAASRAARHPVLDAAASGTLRVETLVGARRATTITKNREKALTDPAA